MKSMPMPLKNKIRQLQAAYIKASRLENEVAEMIKSYGVDIEYLCALKYDDRNTDALAYVTNAEGDVEDNILEIEDVFLYYVNKHINTK